MNDHINDVAASSAAYLYNLLPELMKLSDQERFARLELHFRANIQAFLDCALPLRLPEPSAN